VDGYADDPALVGEALDDCLPDPPGSVCREPAAARIVETLDGLYQADVSLVD